MASTSTSGRDLSGQITIEPGAMATSGAPPGNGNIHDTEPVPMDVQNTTVPEERDSPGTSQKQSQDLTVSPRGVFGWTWVDGVKVPYLLREEKQYVAVRMVEMKLLSRFPSAYPPEIAQRAPLMSHYVTEKEAALLNEINTEHCAQEFGKCFEKADLIVQLADFIEFYEIVKKHFPAESKATPKIPSPVSKAPQAAPSPAAPEPARTETLPATPTTPTPAEEPPVRGGWVQMENTLVPFVVRHTDRLVPLSVVRYAAGLLTDVRVDGVTPSDRETVYFNEVCAEAGLVFKFRPTMKLVALETVLTQAGQPVRLHDLPSKDPFAHATYVTEEPERREPERMRTQPPPLYPGPGALGPPGLPTSEAHMRYPPVMNGIPAAAPPYPGRGVPDQRTLMTSMGPAMFGPQGFPGQHMPSDFPPHMMPQPPKRGRASMYEMRMRMAGNPMFAAGGPSRGYIPRVPEQPRMRGGHMPAHQEMAEMRAMAQRAQARHGHQGALPPRSSHAPQMQSGHMNGLRASPPRMSPLAPPVGGMPQTPSPQMAGGAPGLHMGGRPVGPPRPSPPKHHDKLIKPVEFHGKKISCHVKPDSPQKLALVEAVARVFFPFCELKPFVETLENVLHLRVDTLAPNDEKEFIKFYGLPTDALICNKVVNLDAFEQHLPRLKIMFKEQETTYNKQKQAHDGQSGLLENNNGAKVSPDHQLKQQQQYQQQAMAQQFNNRKRSLENVASKPKKANRLDDILNRLKNAGQPN